MPDSEHHGASAARSGRRLCVLVAEDNELSQTLAVGLLARCGHDAVAVATGSAAVAAWEKGGVDLILMDLQMPGMDGFEATLAIRDKERQSVSRTPIIALTANAAQTDEAKCLAAGMDAFISKPVSFEAFRELIARVIEDRPPAVDSGRAPPGGEVFDLARALDAVDGERELLDGMIGIFLRQTPRVMQDIDGALERGDAAGLENAAHKLKGSVAMFGATSARGAAQRLEDIACAADLAPAGEARRVLRVEIERLQAALERAVDKDER